MKTVIQVVKSARIVADGNDRGEMGRGLFILVGVGPEDTEEDVSLLTDKISRMRIFADENGKMNLSLSDIRGDMAIVSNFTLYANCSHGNRPDFFGAASPDHAKKLYTLFTEQMKQRFERVITGVFGADMQITAVCDGPVTICLQSQDLKRTSR